MIARVCKDTFCTQQSCRNLPWKTEDAEEGVDYFHLVWRLKKKRTKRERSWKFIGHIAVNIGWVHLDWRIVCTLGKRDRACMYWNAPFFHLRSIFFLRFRWWFKYVFMFNHICGNDPIWLAHIFQKGWFNHRSKWSYSTLGKLNGRNLKISQWKKENHLPNLHIFGEPRDQSHYPLLSAGTFGSIMTSGFGPMVVQYISDGFWNHQLGESHFRSFLSFLTPRYRWPKIWMAFTG